MNGLISNHVIIVRDEDHGFCSLVLLTSRSLSIVVSTVSIGTDGSASRGTTALAETGETHSSCVSVIGCYLRACYLLRELHVLGNRLGWVTWRQDESRSRRSSLKVDRRAHLLPGTAGEYACSFLYQRYLWPGGKAPPKGVTPGRLGGLFEQL